MKKLMAVFLAILTIGLISVTVVARNQIADLNPAVQLDGSRNGPTEDGTTPTQRPPKVPVPTETRPPKIPAFQEAALNVAGSMAPNFPGPWTIRLHQWSFFSAPPANYDVSIPQFMDWQYGGGGLITRCIDMTGTQWDNRAMAISMNAPGVLNVYASSNCYGGLTTQVVCIDSYDCRQSRTCDYANRGWQFGWWSNINGSPICATGQAGQPTSMRWGRYNAS